MCVMGDIFAGYMLHYISWDWMIAFGLAVLVSFTGISGVAFFFTVCLHSCMCQHFLSLFLNMILYCILYTKL